MLQRGLHLPREVENNSLCKVGGGGKTESIIGGRLDRYVPDAPLWRSARSVTEIAPKSPFLCLNRIRMRCSFRALCKHSVSQKEITLKVKR